MVVSTERHEPRAGDYVVPDPWPCGGRLEQDHGYSDSEFPGCQFRLPSSWGRLAVNVSATGRPHYTIARTLRSRCRIEFVGDGQPSEFAGGWIYHD